MCPAGGVDCNIREDIKWKRKADLEKPNLLKRMSILGAKKAIVISQISKANPSTSWP